MVLLCLPWCEKTSQRHREQKRLVLYVCLPFKICVKSTQNQVVLVSPSQQSHCPWSSYSQDMHVDFKSPEIIFIFDDFTNKRHCTEGLHITESYRPQSRWCYRKMWDHFPSSTGGKTEGIIPVVFVNERRTPWEWCPNSGNVSYSGSTFFSDPPLLWQQLHMNICSDFIMNFKAHKQWETFSWNSWSRTSGTIPLECEKRFFLPKSCVNTIVIAAIICRLVPLFAVVWTKLQHVWFDLVIGVKSMCLYLVMSKDWGHQSYLCNGEIKTS